MGGKNALTCRGCLTVVKGKNFYSFVSKEIRDLYTGCTAIKIGPDEDQIFPQQLCSVCYKKCEDWRSFRDMCKEGDDSLKRKAQEHVSTQLEKEITARIKQEEVDVDEPFEVVSFIVGEVFREEEDEVEEEAESQGPGELIANKVIEQCPVCDLVLPESVSLKKEHLKEHYSEKVRVCDLVLPESVSLKKEHLKEHYSEKNPKCPICDKKITNSSNLQTHIMSHKRDDQRKHQSDTPKQTSSERPFACGLCDMTFKRNTARVSHQQTLHANKESHGKSTRMKNLLLECPVCHKLFQGYAKLHGHFAVHTDEKPYTCNYCQQERRYKGDLIVHIRRCHPKKSLEKGVSIKKDSILKRERPWEAMGFFDIKRRQRISASSHTCPECAKIFPDQWLLMTHSVVHTGEKPFQCVYCQLVFTRKSSCLKHVRKSHPKKNHANAVVLRKDTKYARELAKLQRKRDNARE